MARPVLARRADKTWTPRIFAREPYALAGAYPVEVDETLEPGVLEVRSVETSAEIDHETNKPRYLAGDVMARFRG